MVDGNSYGCDMLTCEGRRGEMFRHAQHDTQGGDACSKRERMPQKQGTSTISVWMRMTSRNETASKPRDGNSYSSSSTRTVIAQRVEGKEAVKYRTLTGGEVQQMLYVNEESGMKRTIIAKGGRNRLSFINGNM